MGIGSSFGIEVVWFLASGKVGLYGNLLGTWKLQRMSWVARDNSAKRQVRRAPTLDEDSQSVILFFGDWGHLCQRRERRKYTHLKRADSGKNILCPYYRELVQVWGVECHFVNLALNTLENRKQPPWKLQRGRYKHTTGWSKHQASNCSTYTAKVPPENGIAGPTTAHNPAKALPVRGPNPAPVGGETALRPVRTPTPALNHDPLP